ncbi:hypothetical protein J6590_016095 [Homalodisca vitripennis]|nr:hypothetical protein J6590_016095 [Homalodisca vitripennis]
MPSTSDRQNLTIETTDLSSYYKHVPLILLSVAVFRQGDPGSSWYAVLGGCLDVRLLTPSQQDKFEDFSCARDLEHVVGRGIGGGVALCAASRKHFLFAAPDGPRSHVTVSMPRKKCAVSAVGIPGPVWEYEGCSHRHRRLIPPAIVIDTAAACRDTIS